MPENTHAVRLRLLTDLRSAVARLRDQRGVTAVEYAVVAGVITTLIVVGVALIGHGLNGLFMSAVSGFG